MQLKQYDGARERNPLTIVLRKKNYLGYLESKMLIIRSLKFSQIYYSFGCKEFIDDNFITLIVRKKLKEESKYMKSDIHCHVSTLNVRGMFSVPEIAAFCMLWRTPLLLLPTNSFSSASKSRHHPLIRPLHVILFHFISLVLLL